MGMTVPELARRLDRNPGTVRRWIREGKLHLHKVGTQHLVSEEDVARLVAPDAEMLSLPEAWQRTESGALKPNVVAAVRRSRRDH